jgi:hypothetical protein
MCAMFADTIEGTILTLFIAHNCDGQERLGS